MGASPNDAPGQQADATGAVAETAEDREPLPVTWAEYRSVAALLGIFVLCILLALVFAQPFFDAGLQAFEDPEDPGNALFYLVLILVFTFVILWIAKKGLKWLIQAIILGAVGMTMAYVFAPLLWAYVFFATPMGGAISIGLAFLLAAGATFWLYKRPEWYVIDIVGVLVAAGAAAIFGISLAPVVAVILLAGLAIYDAIAVYRTKHMLSLADTVIDLHLPVLLVIPKTRGYSFLREAAKFKEANEENKADREAMFMGLGDLVMPTILVVSALHFSVQAGWGTLPSLGAAIGTLVGFGVLMGYVLKGNPQAGLPLLNGGAIVGFLAGLYQATGSLVFW